MDEDTLQPCGGYHAVLPELVAAGTSLPHTAGTVFYITTLSAGYVCMLMAGTWMSRLLKNNLMDDVFNMENESFHRKPA